MPKDKPTPTLKSLDDMYDSFNKHTELNNSRTRINIENLIPFAGHPFILYEGERLHDMIESIKTNGVLVPIIVRQTADKLAYEILSGHNRVNASKQAGLSDVPALVMDNITDEEAWVYVIETNLIQRSFTDMKHSEKAAVIAMHHTNMFSQGKRNDILDFLNMLDDPTVSTLPHSGTKLESDSTLPHTGAKLRTDAVIGEKYGLSKTTVARYIRVDKLIESLKKRMDNDEIGFLSAVELSYLTDDEQVMIDLCLDSGKVKIDTKKAEALRSYSHDGKLDEAAVSVILNGQPTVEKIKKPFTDFKVSKSILIKYFSTDESVESIEIKIVKALELYFQNSK